MSGAAPVVAVDTSVAIPLLVTTQRAHATVVRWWRGRSAASGVLSLSGHALAETYSVLTRLPGDVRVAPADAARLISVRFGAPLVLNAELAARLPEAPSELGVAGAGDVRSRGRGSPSSADLS